MRVDKKHIIGLIAGLLVAAIVFLAISAYTPPNFLFGTTGGERPTPTPYTGIVTYRAFPGVVSVNSELMSDYDWETSELILTPYIYSVRNFMKCDGKPIYIGYADTLYELLGTSYGGDGQNFFNMPDLASKVPISNLNYQISLRGTYPVPDEASPVSSSAIKYVPFNGLSDMNYIGQIILAKNVPEDLQKEKLIPCDGREMYVNYNACLYSLMEYTFGGQGSKFELPDLSKVTSPVEGAKYYMYSQGIYPPRD